MARVATGLGVRDIAREAGVSPNTVARLERGETLRPETVAKIQAALEAAGADFIDADNGGPGVRLKPSAEGMARSTRGVAKLAKAHGRE